MFDGELGIALQAMQGKRASSLDAGKSHDFSQVTAGTGGLFSSYGRMAIQNSCVFSEVRTPV